MICPGGIMLSKPLQFDKYWYSLGTTMSKFTIINIFKIYIIVFLRKRFFIFHLHVRIWGALISKNFIIAYFGGMISDFLSDNDRWKKTIGASLTLLPPCLIFCYYCRIFDVSTWKTTKKRATFSCSNVALVAWHSLSIVILNVVHELFKNFVRHVCD